MVNSRRDFHLRNVQTCPVGAHPVFCYLGTLALSLGAGGGKIYTGVMLTNYGHLVPRLSGAIPPHPLHTFMACKDTVHHRTDHEGPEMEQSYKCILFLTSAVDGVVDQRHAPAALPPVKTRYPLYRWLGAPHGRSGRVRKISPHTGIRSPDLPARSESLYRLRYPGP
jgi:hypothetical protein